MLETYRYKVDFEKIKSYFEIHEILKRDLDFPDYYGGNLDALWDCLTDQLLSGITHIEIYNLSKTEQFNNYDKKLKDILTMTKHAYGDEFSDRFFVTIVHEDGTREELE